ncbi:MAG: TetR/AcrR family transcriptional regulator [Thermodesulfobacteriota bacterium]|nr:TetR/AcrR family transcriptional regulator [Thermodesulfobacteriota bacterium]
MIKRQKTVKKKGISKNQWLAKALDMFETDGFEAVKIEKLAKQLGTSRSGFYYHFKNRQDLLQHLLAYWAEEYTSVITDNQNLQNLDAEQRLWTTMELVREKKLPKYDLAMTAWAKVDPIVRKVVKKVVKMRLDYTRSIFRELGFLGDELEMRARLFLCYYAWEETMFADSNENENSRLQKLRHTMFIK